MSKMYQESLKKYLSLYFEEDDLSRNFHYLKSLPTHEVQCFLKIKDDLVLAGLPFFFETFNFLLDTPLDYQRFLEFEGKKFKKEDKREIEFTLPFNIALTAERIALNLVQRTSSIATYTNTFVEKARNYSIEILDTGKTIPGLRYLEKYATQVGGAKNHRFGQMDVWMIKDNHKNTFGGLNGAVEFFKKMNSFYQPLIIEIHSLEELKEAKSLGLKHLMLDNFSPAMIQEAISLKEETMTFEASGGINLENITDYLIKGLDAISMGGITYNAPHVDLSLKYYAK